MAKGKQEAVGDSSSGPCATAGLVRSMRRAELEVNMAAVRHTDLGAAHASALAALGEHAAAAEGDPELSHLLDLFRAKLDLLPGGGGWERAKEHIHRHCRLEIAQQPYSLTALKLWVDHSAVGCSGILGAYVITHTLRDWVEGPFTDERWEACWFLSPADEKAVASLSKKQRVQALISELKKKYLTARSIVSQQEEDQEQQHKEQAVSLSCMCVWALQARGCCACMRVQSGTQCTTQRACILHARAQSNQSSHTAPCCAPLSVLGRSLSVWRVQRCGKEGGGEGGGARVPEARAAAARGACCVGV
jgi:hypothetical protein